jgi:hypothetical protein
MWGSAFGPIFTPTRGFVARRGRAAFEAARQPADFEATIDLAAH